MKFLKLLPFFIILLTLSTHLMAQKTYDKNWAKVDSLTNLNLPKSALAEVDNILKMAKTEGNSQQVIKAFIHRLKFNNQTEDYAFEKHCYELDSMISTSSFPDNAIMHSMLGEMYYWYYENNRWKFYNRTNTSNFENNDMQTWTLDNLVAQMIFHYKASLNDAVGLQNLPIKNFKILSSTGTQPEELRPTLYDFIAHRAIDFFSKEELALTKPADNYQLKEAFYFGNTSNFVNANINTSDTLSLHFHALKTIQELEKYNLTKNHSSPALAAVAFKRLKLAYQFSVLDNKDELYLNALVALEKKFKKVPFSSQITYQIALQHFNYGNKYNINKVSTHKYKNEKIKALKLCQNAVKKYPESYGAELCKALMVQIQRHSVTFNTELILPSNQQFPVFISYQNTNKVYIRTASIGLDKYTKLAGKYYDKELYDKLFKASTAIEVTSQKVLQSEDFNTHSTEVLLKGLNLGYYLIIVSDNNNFTYKKGITSYNLVRVSDIAYIWQPTYKGGQRIFVADRTTGTPLAGVKCQVWSQKYSYTKHRYVQKKFKYYLSDKNGMVEISPNQASKRGYETYYVDFYYKKDFLSNNSSFYLYENKHKEQTSFSTKFFTDRAIYRPSQKIFFKGICLKTKGEKTEIVTQKKQTVTLYDTNSQKVSSIEVTSNDYGTFSGTFDIPVGLLNGQFYIGTNEGSIYISVEEYKRPKFETKLDAFKGNYKLNEKVSVTGKATSFAGSVISGADVKYTVTRTPKWNGWYSYYFNNAPIVIKNGTTKTDDSGKYKIEFEALPDLAIKESEFASFSYQIKVDVTDISGETQSTSNSLSIGFRALQVGLPLSGDINKNDPKFNDKKNKLFEIQTTNYNGEFIEANGKITIYALNAPKKVLRTRFWAKPDAPIFTKEQWNTKFPGNVYAQENSPKKMKQGKLVKSLTFDTKKSKKEDFSFLKDLPTGYYCAEIKSTDSFGKEVSNKHFFQIIAEKETQMPYASTVFFKQLNSVCQPGENANFLLGSSYKNVTVIYQIEVKDKIVHTNQITLSNEVKKITIPVTKEHRGNFGVHFIFIKNNRSYSEQAVIFVPHTDKKLDIEFSSFRDKLLPGQKEEWKLTIKGEKGEKLAAEMMATLYDASLDQFKENNWNFDIYKNYYASISWSSGTFTQNSSNQLKQGIDEPYYITNLYYPKFNWFNFSYYNYNYRMLYTEDAEMEESAVAPPPPGNILQKLSGNISMRGKSYSIKRTRKESGEDNFDDVLAEVADQTVVQELMQTENSTAKGMGSVKVRTNFNETAFFYPHLLTNENGKIEISFTIPESLTKWKMMGFAHTKDLKFGFVNNQLVTQKDLMLMPNAPRFFRENDKITFPVKVSNVSKNDLNGDIQLEFFDAITMKPIANIFANTETSQKTFSVKAGGNILVEWNLEIPEGISAITYKVVAKAGKFSDGEQKPLPVLSNRMLVTESFPLPIRGNESKTFKFKKLLKSGKSSSIRNYKLTLEFTSNPAWYAVQALPYLIEYPYECSEQTFSRFYANSIAAHAANSSPKIKRVFDAWKNTPNSGALLSNLEKNQELKSVMLEETPWVLDGKNESQRKKRIGLLFDLNKMAHEQSRALKKLQKAQKLNGGWPWFEGMKESRYITQYIANGLGHLDKLGVKSVREDADTWKMLKKAIGFLDAEIVEQYRLLKKYYSAKEMKENHLSSSAIQYLYGRTFFNDLPKSKKTQEVYNYFEGQAQKYWTSQSIYMQGMIALALKRNTKNSSAQKTVSDIVKSLKENATHSQELGMYWKNNRAGYYWYQAPIETQALMIEVFDQAANDLETVQELKIWLLKQKQTQDWKTTRATAEAVYALLLRGTGQLESDKQVEIHLGNQLIDPTKIDGLEAEAGTGYFKTSWSGSDIKPEMGKITLVKKDAGIAWGALYWQYFEDLDKITPHKTPLSLKKQLFIEQSTTNGKVLVPVNNSDLKIGDKVIVRIELRVDRRMEYIHMKDMRASGFEPINVISQYKYQDGLGYYESTKDAATNFFMGSLPKGTYVFEYPLRVSHKGDFANGITTIQCMYAPEFTSHSEGIRVNVK